MPQWVPSDMLSRQSAFMGAVRVSISAAGRVEAAVIERSVHPAYDPLLLQAARAWEYQPARNEGVPVPSEQLVQYTKAPSIVCAVLCGGSCLQTKVVVGREFCLP